jgi:pyruvate dehydrogenase E2 component (dihydrolipoamide acetyltransferase)
MADVFMPRLSDTMEEGVLSQWLKKEGDAVAKGDVLAEVETDKAMMELEAYDEGVLVRVLVPEGATVPIGATIAVIGKEGDEVGGGAPAQQQEQQEQAAAPEQPDVPAESAPAPAQEPSQPSQPSPAPAPAPAGNAPVSSPLARRIARENGIDLAGVTGSGPGGRIVRADVEDAISADGRKQPPVQAPAAARPTAAPAPVQRQPSSATDSEELPLSRIRKITAQRLTDSSRDAPHFYLTSVVNVEKLLAFRRETNEALAAVGVKVSVNDLLVRAAAVVLRRHPNVNASWGEDKLLRHRRINVGVAVALEDGLIVPVVRDADRKSLNEIATETRELAEKARSGKLTPDEFSGGTFTISNLGMFGIDHFTAVINPPEAAILAVGAAKQEAVVRDGEIVAESRMKLTLSIDHRVLDGASAAAYLRDLTELLEEPLRVVV